jgi:hypothetical protein
LLTNTRPPAFARGDVGGGLGLPAVLAPTALVALVGAIAVMVWALARERVADRAAI